MKLPEMIRFTFESKTKGDKPMDLALEDMFGSSPKTILQTKRLLENIRIHDIKRKI